MSVPGQLRQGDVEFMASLGCVVRLYFKRQMDNLSLLLSLSAFPLLPFSLFSSLSSLHLLLCFCSFQFQGLNLRLHTCQASAPSLSNTLHLRSSFMASHYPCCSSLNQPEDPLALICQFKSHDTHSLRRGINSSIMIVQLSGYSNQNMAR